MAQRFVRIDLSRDARDFRPLALEPGVPTLDDAGTNARLLSDWIGRMAADPEWEGESVNFYVQDDEGGHLEDVTVQPASADDLRGPLKKELETLQERLSKAQPENTAQRALHRALTESLRQLTEDPSRSDLDAFFFRYRDANDQLRLVWCWGYQRTDGQIAPAVVCGDRECSLLFVRRPGQSPKCPSCEAILAAGRKKRRRVPWKRYLLAALLLLVVGGALVYWWMNPHRLIATPDTWTGPAGSRIDFAVAEAGLWGRSNVTGQAVAVSADPTIVRIDGSGAGAVAVNPGETEVHFYLGDLITTATISVGPAEVPEKVAIEPASVALALGTTARLKLIGHYADGSQQDLTAQAEWDAKNDGVVYFEGGLLEGLAEGASTVGARYRATPEAALLEASAEVTVADVELVSLEMSVEPEPVALGRQSRMRIDALTPTGERYRVAESSRLELQVDPDYRAEVDGEMVKGLQPGRAALSAVFDDRLTQQLSFDVVRTPGVDRLVVTPERIGLVVGQVADLSIHSPSAAPISVSSSDPVVVEVTSDRRLVARAAGSANITVRQGQQSQTVSATVEEAEFTALTADPSPLVVAVDHAANVRALGWLQDGRKVELAPDFLECIERPAPRFAWFDAQRMELHGRWPTDPSAPQKIGLGMGALTTSAPVRVVVAPMRLRLTPGGKIDVPVGQVRRLRAWANYRNGHRVEVLPERLRWFSEPETEAVEGLDLRDGRLMAMKPGVGPAAVWATYFNNPSDRVEVTTTDAEPVKLGLEVDRTLRLAGEPGLARLSATGPRGDVELVPELAQYRSADEKTIKVDKQSGAFRAVAAGQAAIEVRHPASAEPGSLVLQVVDPSDARLAFEPAAIRMAVDEIQQLQLYLEGKVNDKTVRAPIAGPNVAYQIARPEAIWWFPPLLAGVQPAASFEIGAAYPPLLTRPALATVEVTPDETPEAVRIVAEQATLAPGQPLALTVEQQQPGDETWSEVRPSAVEWEVPDRVVWSPPTEGLRPTIRLAEDSPNTIELTARYGGQSASYTIGMKSEKLDPSDPSVSLRLVREPPGEYLPVGMQQRYTIMLSKGEEEEPAAAAQWPSDFENPYVRWNAPVLTARQPGEEQWLQAEVGGRAVRFRTVTIDPTRPIPRVPARPDQPVAVNILSDQGEAVRFPVNAEFDDFRVEAEYADGFTRVVTKQATLAMPDGPYKGPVTFEEGHMLGVRPGRTEVVAEFDGVASSQRLAVEVTAEVDVDEIRVQPTPISLLPSESVALDAVGYRNGKSIGRLNRIGGLSWSSDAPDVAQVSGPTVTAGRLGRAQVSARLGKADSRPAEVNVVDSLAEALAVDQDVLQLRVGESRRIGVDLAVFRGDLDLSHHCDVTPAMPSVVRYDPQTHSLVGRSPGVSAVSFTSGSQLATAKVEVLPGGPIEGRVVVEPSGGVLASGQAIRLRALVVTDDGRRFDRTSAAVFRSSDPAKLKMLGNQACAATAGTVEIFASVPGASTPGKAYVNIVDEPITELRVEPGSLDMSVGDEARLTVLGTASSGTHELYPQSDLAVAVGGASPNAIRVAGSQLVDALAEGEAEVNVAWQRRLRQSVPVRVSDDPWQNLQLDPAIGSVRPGQALVYRATAVRGGRVHVVGPEDGLRLQVARPEVAGVVDRMTVAGKQAGETGVVAQLGGQNDEAILRVTPGTGVVGEVVGGDDSVGVYGPGYGTRYYGGDWIDDRVVSGDDGEIIRRYAPPAADAVDLRFAPEAVQIPLDSAGARFRVMEVLADGSLGRDVTADPNLEISDPQGTVRVDKTADGPVLRPLEPGQTRLAARLGLLTSESPLLVQVGEGAATTAAWLQVVPDPLDLWVGQTSTFDQVLVVEDGLTLPFSVGYRLTAEPGQGVYAVENGNRIRGTAAGIARVTVTTVDSSGAYDGLSVSALVRVDAADVIRIEPSTVELRVGERTPAFSVVAQGPDGTVYGVPAALESADPSILVPDPSAPDRFVAQSVGGTQVRAIHRGREATAEVRITGERFVDVETTLNEGPEDFGVTIEVLAAKSEGALEYRVYVAGQPPGGTWTPAEDQGDYQRAVVRSPQIGYGPRSARYHLVIESRDVATGSVQRYPFTFRLVPNIQRTDAPPGGGTR